MRTQFHDEEDRDRRWRINRLYRLIKWDVARLHRRLLSPQQCRELYQQVDAAVGQSGEQEIVVDPRTLPLELGELEYGRHLVYRL